MVLLSKIETGASVLDFGTWFFDVNKLWHLKKAGV